MWELFQDLWPLCNPPPLEGRHWSGQGHFGSQLKVSHLVSKEFVSNKVNPRHQSHEASSLLVTNCVASSIYSKCWEYNFLKKVGKNYFRLFILYWGVAKQHCFRFQVTSERTYIYIQPHTHKYMCLLSLPPRLPPNTEQSSLCYTRGPCWLFILNTAVCTYPPQTP